MYFLLKFKHKKTKTGLTSDTMGKYQRKVGGRSYQNYSSKVLEKAVKEIKMSHEPLRKVAEKYGIPKSTLSDHLKKQGLPILKPGGQPVLSHVDENYLTSGLIKCSEWGFPLRCTDIQIIVQNFLNRCGRKINRFKNNLPGLDWVRLFLSRNKSLTKRLGENIKRVRAGISKSVLDKYFDNLEVVIRDIPASNIFNYDETNFCDDPGKNLVVVRRGVKHPEIIRDSSKSSTSVMFCVSASGQVLPPYTVYKSVHLYPTWVEGGVKDARYNRNISGWFDMNIFEDWFSTLFIAYIKNLEGPKVLIGDNLASHLSLEVIKLCDIHNIHFVLLPPNSTHLCQPLDIAFFRPLKGAWRKTLDDWKKKNKGVLPKAVFPQMLKKSLESIESLESNVKSGFKAAGIVPFNRDCVISKVKSRPEDEEIAEETRNTSWSDAFVDILQEFRLGDNVETKARGKKITIEPGKSVRVEDFVNRKDNDEELIDEPYPQEIEVSPDNNEPSTSGTFRNIQSKETCQLNINDFVLIKYETNKNFRQYIGQILEVDYPILNVNFLRKKISYSGSPYFVFPVVPDKSRINKVQVVTKVKLLSKQKRDRYFFDIDVTNIE